jgi:hypothetical protein
MKESLQREVQEFHSTPCWLQFIVEKQDEKILLLNYVLWGVKLIKLV